MTCDEYRKAKRDLGYDKRGRQKEWLKLIGISESTHLSYMCGRIKVNTQTEIIINLLYQQHNKKGS